jgi:hypothetical protein
MALTRAGTVLAATLRSALDRPLYASDFVSLKVVHHNGITAPEFRNQALLYVSQEHSPFMAPLTTIGATILL